MLDSLHAQILASGLIDLDGTFFVQLAIFLLFATLLNILLVKPLMKTPAARHAHMAGAREEAERMNLEAADDSETYETRIAEARQQALNIRNSLRDAATEEAGQQLALVRDETQGRLAEGRASVSAAREATRGDADDAVEALASAIADQVLGGKA